jgi:hypothetical protein
MLINVCSKQNCKLCDPLHRRANKASNKVKRGWTISAGAWLSWWRRNPRPGGGLGVRKPLPRRRIAGAAILAVGPRINSTGDGEQATAYREPIAAAPA